MEMNISQQPSSGTPRIAPCSEVRHVGERSPLCREDRTMLSLVPCCKSSEEQIAGAPKVNQRIRTSAVTSSWEEDREIGRDTPTQTVPREEDSVHLWSPRFKHRRHPLQGGFLRQEACHNEQSCLQRRTLHTKICDQVLQGVCTPNSHHHLSPISIDNHDVRRKRASRGNLRVEDPKSLCPEASTCLRTRSFAVCTRQTVPQRAPTQKHTRKGHKPKQRDKKREHTSTSNRDHRTRKPEH